MAQDISVIREQIDEVDSKIVELIEKRMELSLDIADYKSRTGKAIYDREREQEKLEKLGNMAHGKFNAKSVQEIFTQIIAVSKRYQYRAIGDREHFVDGIYKQIDDIGISKDTKVCYAGVMGAFAESALAAFFGENVMSTNVKDFAEVARMVEEGKTDYGVLPIENSTAGFVNGIYDLLEKHKLSIVGEQMIQVNQCLLGLPGTDINKIKTVFSHPQGLMQSKEFLEDKNWKQVSMGNTALAAKKVKEDKDITQAAIASERAAKIYGLEILNPRLNVSGENTTRFVIVSKNREYVKDANRVSISFSLPHAVGSLYNILAHFIFNDVNMTSIESVPVSDRQWEYCFFVDFEGSLSDNDVKNALMAIRAETENFQIIGCFKSEK